MSGILLGRQRQWHWRWLRQALERRVRGGILVPQVAEDYSFR